MADLGSIQEFGKRISNDGKTMGLLQNQEAQTTNMDSLSNSQYTTADGQIADFFQGSVDEQKAALVATYNFSNDEADALIDVLNADHTDGVSEEEYNATISAIKQKLGDDATVSDFAQYAFESDAEELEALDSEIQKNLDVASVGEDAAQTEMLEDSSTVPYGEDAALEEMTSGTAEEIVQNLDEILESGDLSALSKLGTEIETGVYGEGGITTASQIMREVFDMDYYSEDGQKVWNKLVEINNEFSDSAVTSKYDQNGSPIVLANSKIYFKLPTSEQ